MLCSDIPKAHPVNLCADDDARLWLGETLLTGMKARFQNLGSGHISIHDVQKESDEAWMEHPDLAPGFYLVQLVYGTGAPIQFTPYVLNGDAFEAAQNSYFGVTVEIEQVKDQGNSTYTSNDQWLSI